jgi:hypothetical protein
VWASDSSFRLEAPLTVNQPGLVEVVLPPELHFASDKGLDLKVLGPEGKTRPFELYWKKAGGEQTETLREISAQLLDDSRFRWEGKLEKPARITRIWAFISAGDYMGKVDVFGLKGKEWKLLASEAAVYQINGKSRAEISVPPDIYASFRLEFTAYNQKAKQELLPLETVEAVSETPGGSEADESIPLRPKRMDLPGAAGTECYLTCGLPGSGLWVNETDLVTDGAFKGDWRLIQQQIVNGRQAGTTLRQGRVEYLGQASNTLKMETHSQFKGKDLKLELETPYYVGPVRRWVLEVKLPRLVFRADEAGVYRVQAGCGEDVAVLEAPTSQERKDAESGQWGQVRPNPDWRPESLVEKYNLGGGPFDGRDYTWQAPLTLAGPGYYRVLLNQRAALEGNWEGLRIVRAGRQVPYFQTSGATREVSPAVSEDYDRSKNRTVWTITLPQASARWVDLVLGSEGIFQRNLLLEKQNPGSLAWEPIEQGQWGHKENGAVETRFSTQGNVLEGVTKLRLSMDHGDNQPLKLSKISLDYYAPALCFLADAGDKYFVAGGNPTAPSPQYDLSLVEGDLLAQEPRAAEMGDCRPLKGQGMKLKLFKVFKGTKWGLYGVLGLVTLILILIVARLFPEIGDKGSKSNRD